MKRWCKYFLVLISIEYFLNNASFGIYLHKRENIYYNKKNLKESTPIRFFPRQSLFTSEDNYMYVYAKYFTNGWWSFLTERYTLSAAHYYTWVAIEMILKQLNFIFSTRKYTILSTNLEFYLGSVIGIGWYPAKFKFKYWQIGFLEISLNIMKVIMWLCRAGNIYFQRMNVLGGFLQGRSKGSIFSSIPGLSFLNYYKIFKKNQNANDNVKINYKNKDFIKQTFECLGKVDMGEDKVYKRMESLYKLDDCIKEGEKLVMNPFLFFVNWKNIYKADDISVFFSILNINLSALCFLLLTIFSEFSLLNIKILKEAVKLKFFTLDKTILLIKTFACIFSSDIRRVVKGYFICDSIIDSKKYYSYEDNKENLQLAEEGWLYVYRNMNSLFFTEKDGLILKILEFLIPYVCINIQKLFNFEKT